MEWYPGEGTLEVKCTVLDRVCVWPKLFLMFKPRLVKLDRQGAVLRVLHGTRCCLLVLKCSIVLPSKSTHLLFRSRNRFVLMCRPVQKSNRVLRRWLPLTKRTFRSTLTKVLTDCLFVPTDWVVSLWRLSC